jgi:hypothetical protein
MTSYWFGEDSEIEETRDIVEGSFMEFARSESYVSPGERAWLRWVQKAERLFGDNLDGNDDRDGYSMDGAYGAFEASQTPAEYVADVAQRRDG